MLTVMKVGHIFTRRFLRIFRGVSKHNLSGYKSVNDRTELIIKTDSYDQIAPY